MIANHPPDPEATLSAGWAPSTEPPIPTVQLFARNAGPLGEHELILAPGATAQDLSSALVLIPPDSALIEFGGDIDLSLVFREIPRPGTARKPGPSERRVQGEVPAAADAP